MSEHAWTLENLAAYVAGGLEPAERERLERHAAECADCSRALAGARRADRQFMTLFADVRPGPMFEDRLIRTMRKPRERARRPISPMWIKVPLAMAALAMLAVLGAGITALIDNDWLPDFAARDETTKESGGYARQARTYFGSDRATTKADPFLTEDIDPGLMEADTDIKFMAQRKPDVSVPGGVRPDEAVGITNGDKNKPPTNLPAPGGYGKLGQGGAIEGTSGSGKSGKRSAKQMWSEMEMDLLPQKPRFADINRKMQGMDTGGVLAGLTPSGTLSPEQKPSGTGGMLGGFGGGMGSGMMGRVGGGPPPAPPGRSTNGDLEGYFMGTVTAPLQAAQTPGQDKQDFDKLKESDKQNHGFKVRVRTDPGKSDPGGEKKPAQAPPEQPRPSQRYIIRTGDIEFEVDSFDVAAAIVRKLVAATKGAVVATENSDRLVNGKVRGAIVVRMPPEHLDQFVLDLRKELGKTGELKGQKIGSEDVSKTYIDLESRLKAARTMEQRLLKIIKDGKGEIKDLVLAEKELGVWNTKIEEIEGELRYYQTRISLSTLTISLTEKEIRTAAAVRESERINAGVEVDDVEKAMREVLKAVEDAKGRVRRSEMKQHTGGQFSAVLVFDVAPDSAGPIRDRLNQLGTIARLEIDRVQTPEGGEKLPPGGRLDRGNTQFIVSLYNLANVTPQETVTLRVAAVDVAEAYRTVRAAIVKAKGRIMGADLDQKTPQDVGANLTFAVPREAEAAIRAALGEAGVVLTRSVNRVATPTGDGKDLAKLVTDKKVEYKLELVSATAIEPRETVGMAIEVTDVEQTLDVLTANVKELKGRVVRGPESQHELNGRVTAFVVYEVPLSAEPALAEKLRNSGHVRAKKTVPNHQAPEGKLATARFIVTLANAEVLVPRDEGMMAYINRGLSYSLRGLSVSLSVLIVGVLFVLPWVLVITVVWWLARRIWWRPAPARPAPAAPMPTPPAASV